MGYSCLSWLNLETVAGGKLEVSIAGFLRPEKMKGLNSKLFKNKKASPDVCIIDTSVCVHTFL